MAALVFKLIMAKSKFKKTSKNNILRYPLGYRLAPLAFVGYFAVVTGLVLWQGIESDWFYMAVSGVVAVGGIVLMILWSLWRVKVGESSFMYVSITGKKRTYNYADLELVHNDSGTKWYFYLGQDCVFCMPYFITNGKSLEKAYENFRKTE